MKTFYLFISCLLLTGCGLVHNSEDDNVLTSKFNGTWNIHEGIERDFDGVITYHALPWGGLVASVKKQNMPVDWSEYESICFEFAKPTEVATQINISDKIRTTGKPGITSLTCYFDGQDMRSIDEIALQAVDTSTLYVKRVFLTPGSSVWESTPIWEGNCSFGNWENGFVIKPEQFISALEGDKLELIYKTDTSDPSVTYWLFKTVINTTDTTLEGNENELNPWGCVMMGKASKVYRIILTANDIKKLRENGLFVNGYYNIVTQVNLLRRGYVEQ